MLYMWVEDCMIPRMEKFQPIRMQRDLFKICENRNKPVKVNRVTNSWWAVLEKKSQSMFFMLVQSIAGVFFYETYKLLYPDS